MKIAIFWVVEPCSLVEVYNVSEVLAASTIRAMSTQTAIFVFYYYHYYSAVVLYSKTLLLHSSSFSGLTALCSQTGVLATYSQLLPTISTSFLITRQYVRSM
jgi:hypothetical protein